MESTEMCNNTITFHVLVLMEEYLPHSCRDSITRLCVVLHSRSSF